MSDMYLYLILTTLLVSPSGALSPGPLSVTTIALGSSRNGWRTGIKVAIGHTLAELPYIIILSLFFSKLEILLYSRLGDILVILSFIVILYFSLSLIIGSFKTGEKVEEAGSIVFKDRDAIIAGVLLTGLNVFFLIWWLSIGTEIISSAIELGLTGIIIMYISHVWMDYAWLAFLAEIGRKGKSVLGMKGYRYLLLFLGILLLLFGINMLTKRFLNLSFI